MGQYRAGTVEVENGNNVVTGTDTEFLTNVSEGGLFTILGSGVPYVVGGVLDDETLVLTELYAGFDATGQAYVVHDGFTPVLGIPIIEQGDIETHTIFKRAMLALEAAISGEGAAITIADGEVTSPGLRLASELSTGLYKIGAGQLGVAVLGIASAMFTGNGVNAALGVDAPAEAHVTTLEVTTSATVAGSAVVTLAAAQTLTNKTLTGPVMTAPTLGVASATSVNKVAITAPASSATLTLADGSSLITVGAYAVTLTATGATGITLPTGGTLLTTTGTGAGLTAVDAITLLTKTWAAPAAIGSGTPAAGTFTALRATGNLIVDGSITQTGGVTMAVGQTLTVEDPLIKMGVGNVTDAVDLGFYGVFQPASTPKYAGLFRDATDSKWKLFKDLEVEPTTTVNIGGTGYAVATLVANIEGAVTGNASTATALATGRAINGVTFDGTAAITVTAAAGTLTGATLAAGVTASSLTSLGTIAALVAGTGSFSGAVATTDATDATSTATGSVKTAGGLGVVKALWVGGLANIAGNTTLQGTLDIASTFTLTKASGHAIATIVASTAANSARYECVTGGNTFYIGKEGSTPAFGALSGEAFLYNGGLGISMTYAASPAVKIPGTLQVGSASNPNGNVAIFGYVGSSGSAGIEFRDSSAGSTNQYGLKLYRNGSLVGSVQTTDVATLYVTSSDARLKNDLGICADVSVLEGLRIRDFEWLSDGSLDRGVFAQEAQAIKPRAIAHNAVEDTWSVDYSKFVPDLVVGWQNHEARVTALRQEFDQYRASHP